MAKVRNVSDGALDVPVFNRIVLPDEAVDCTNEVAAGFHGQPDWQVELDEEHHEQGPAHDEPQGE